MNHLIYLNTKSGELEKILSGIKTMIIKDLGNAQQTSFSVNPGDSLYFMRDKEETTLRVKAAVVKVTSPEFNSDEDLSPALKEMQPKLQLTEKQFHDWSSKKQVLFVEFVAAQKIEGIQLTTHKFMSQADWIAFEDFSVNV